MPTDSQQTLRIWCVKRELAAMSLTHKRVRARMHTWIGETLYMSRHNSWLS